MTTTPTRPTLSASTLIGDDVRNPSGEELGTLTEIMLDTETGQVSYGVLDVGGFLGIGNKLFAVPWTLLELDADGHEFVIDISKETLEHAPGFDQDQWPDFADRTWGASVHAHYGVDPYWT